MRRRRFVTWSTAGLSMMWAAAGVVLGAFVRFLSPEVLSEPPRSFKIGNPADFPISAPTFFSQEKIYVFHDAGRGFAVASAVCTHLGCTVRYFASDDRFHCPCHGSVFAPDGRVLHGAAPRALRWYEVTLDRDGQLRVNKDRTVPSSYHLLV